MSLVYLYGVGELSPNPVMGEPGRCGSGYEWGRGPGPALLGEYAG
jgi:hypothetical protein